MSLRHYPIDEPHCHGPKMESVCTACGRSVSGNNDINQ